MTDHDFDDEIFMAYADGELDIETAARVEIAVRENVALAERLAVFTATRDTLADAAALARKSPVPNSLTQRVTETIQASRPDTSVETVVSLATRRPVRRFLPAVAFAAGFAALGLITGLVIGPGAIGPGTQGLHFAVLDGAAVPEALSSVPSGEPTAITGGEIEVIASFVTAEDVFCREFELDRPDAMTVIAVACRSGTEWIPRFAVVSPADDGTGFAPASSMETLDAYLSAIEAGAPMSLEEEADRLAMTGE